MRDVRDRVQDITMELQGEAKATYHIRTLEGVELVVVFEPPEAFAVTYPDGSEAEFDSLNSVLMNASAGYGSAFMGAIHDKLSSLLQADFNEDGADGSTSTPRACAAPDHSTAHDPLEDVCTPLCAPLCVHKTS
uniref:GSKIP domain-containing protein n=1 Tax=Eutreptiella gymnastica TaxID=73025 RepID=A0A7S4GIY7_9EUGL